MSHLATPSTRRPPTAPPLVAGADSRPAADLDRRFYAFFLDRLAAWSLYAVAAYAAELLIHAGDTWLGVGVVVGAVLLVGLSSAVLLGLRGTSPGRAALGMRVVDVDRGGPIGVPAAMLRAGVLGLATLPTFGLGVATLAWTAAMDPSGRRRAWHDRLCHAVVVDVRPAPVREEAADPAPRAVVNLTALRLVPPSVAPPEVTAPLPVPEAPRTPPPTRPPTLPPPPSAPPTGAQAAAVPVPPPAVPPPPLAPPPPAPRSGDVDRTVVRAPAPASARWRVSFDSGESFVVEGLALVGRRPEPRPGEPVRHLVALPSADMSLSKTHAQFLVAPDGALVVMDRGSTNGSLLVRGGASRALGVGRPATLVEGDLVRFGDRSMTVARLA